MKMLYENITIVLIFKYKDLFKYNSNKIEGNDPHGSLSLDKICVNMIGYVHTNTSESLYFSDHIYRDT